MNQSVIAIDNIINDVKPVQRIQNEEYISPEHVNMHEAKRVVLVSIDGIVS